MFELSGAFMPHPLDSAEIPMQSDELGCPDHGPTEYVSVLIVDDCQAARMALRNALIRDNEIQIIGEAEDGEQAMRLVERRNPGLVLMDVYLRRQNGLDVTESIMSRSPRPILVITAADPSNPQLIYRAMEAGALDVVAKLPLPSSKSYEHERRRLVNQIKRLARVPVVRRRAKPAQVCSDTDAEATKPLRPQECSWADQGCSFSVVVIGASTGGPPVVDCIIRSLSKSFTLPIVVVQHMAVGFVAGFADWLEQASGREVIVVKNAADLRPGKVFIAPDNAHLRLQQNSLLAQKSRTPLSQYCPSIDLLFKSIAHSAGRRSIGVLLTGMGNDGVDGMRTLHAEGALTIAQSPATCVVDSMPRAAIEMGYVAITLDPERIGPYLEMRAKSQPRP
jgi:two-component system chemotaxis response regulator CheB